MCVDEQSGPFCFDFQPHARVWVDLSETSNGALALAGPANFGVDRHHDRSREKKKKLVMLLMLPTHVGTYNPESDQG